MSTRKKFTYKGKEIEELMDMPMAQLVDLMPARRRRSLRSPSFWTKERQKLRDKIRTAAIDGREGKQKRPIRTHVRVMPILPEMIGAEVHVHNGREFITVKIIPEMIGFLLGEFSPTRKIVQHGNPGLGATRSSAYVPLK